jgi:hypothetical protein
MHDENMFRHAELHLFLKANLTIGAAALQIQNILVCVRLVWNPDLLLISTNRPSMTVAADSGHF